MSTNSAKLVKHSKRTPFGNGFSINKEMKRFFLKELFNSSIHLFERQNH